MGAPQQALLAAGHRYTVSLPDTVESATTGISVTAHTLIFERDGDIDSSPGPNGTSTVWDPDVQDASGGWADVGANAFDPPQWCRPGNSTDFPGQYFDFMVELLSGTLDSTSGAATPANRDNWHNGNDFGSFIFQAAIGIAPSTSESATMRISIRDTVTQALYAVCEWTITATDT